MSKFKGKKTNNTSLTNAKEKLRLLALDEIENPAVLEVCCGDGAMFRKVWFKADAYTGIDIEHFSDERETIQGDAIDVLKRIDLDKYNIFDLDPYGSPYEMMAIITSRIKSNKKIAFVVTDGISIDLKMGRLCNGIRIMTGIGQRKITSAHKIHKNLIMLSVKNAANKLNCAASKVVFSKGRTGASMMYYFFTITPREIDQSSMD